MKRVHCAAVDLGATSGRVLVGTWDGDALTHREVYRFQNQFRSLGDREYWDLPALWTEVRAGLGRARSLYPGLASVGIDGWAVDHVLVGRDGRPVYPVHSYRDLRTAGASERLGRGAIQRVYRLTGIPNYPYNTSLQLQDTLAAAPGIERSADRCLFIPDYFNFLLSGRMENELSMASHSQLIGVHGRDWSPSALRHFGVPARWFGKPRLSPGRLGTVVSGLPELRGVLSVMVPGHDTACAFLAMPASPDGSDLFLSSGTWSLLGIESPKPLLGPAALAARISNERMGDGGYRPLKSCLGLWLLERALLDFKRKPRDPSEWRSLIASAGKQRGAGGLIDLTDETLFNPPSMRAAIDAQLARRGLDRPRDLVGYVNLICLSIARGHANAAGELSRLSGRSFGRILMVGGGSRNRLLCQATADLSGLPVTSHNLEGAAVGNLASQLIALGEVGDVASFRGILSRRLRRVDYAPR